MATQVSGIIDRAVRLMDKLHDEAGMMTLSDLSRRTGLAKSTTLRLLGSLVAAGVVERVGARYRLVWQLRSPVSRDREDVNLLRILSPHAGDLFLRTRRTVGLVVLRGNEVRYLQRIHGYAPAWTDADETGHEPAFQSAAGRILMAYDPTGAYRVKDSAEIGLTTEMPQSKKSGYAITESADGVVCLAAPVFGANGVARAALTVEGRSDYFDRARALHCLRIVTTAATRALRMVTEPPAGAIPAQAGLPALGPVEKAEAS